MSGDRRSYGETNGDSAFIRGLLLWISRRVDFVGKGRLFALLGVGVDREKLIPAGVDTVECIEGIRIQTSSPQDIMFRELYVHGHYQDDVLVALRQLLRPGDVFWDIGANYGFMSIYVDRAFGGRVRSIAFEPSPRVVPELRRNLALNACRSVEVEELCVSDRRGTVRFFTSPDNSWNATMIDGFAQSSGETECVEVQSTTIDELVAKLPLPSVIKVDVEGAEALVIAGGRRHLSERRPPIVIEYNVTAIRDGGSTPEGFLESFRELGYQVHVLKRPMWERHSWKDLRAVRSPRELAMLCNLILLPA